MSGDLEDFLRRAAQRRQAKAAAQPAQQPKAKPQYSNSRTERMVRPAEADEILTAEVIEDSDSIADRRKKLEQAKAAAAEAKAKLAAKKTGQLGTTSAGAPSSASLSGMPAQDLIRLLRQPGGIRQAILLREILERPEHRW